MVVPELAKDGVDLGLRQSFPRRKRPYHLGEDQPAAAFASRPLEDPAFPPKGPEPSHFFRGRAPPGVDHGPIVGTPAAPSSAGTLTAMLLAIDLGNTNLTFGLFEGDRLRHDWRLATRRDSMPDELGLLMVQLMRQDGFDPKAVEAVVVASVVPPLNSSLVEAIQRYFGREPIMVGPGIKTGLKIHYRDPKEVGADRIVAAMAAFKKYGGPLIIIDFGTGTTYDVVSKEGDYLGGAIAPGMGISVEALYDRAARLQRVELKAPATVIGRTTAESMQAGIIFGFTAQVEGMVARIRRELGENARVIATGGLAGLIAAETSVIELVDQRLMLEGLRLIYDLNA